MLFIALETAPAFFNAFMCLRLAILARAVADDVKLTRVTVKNKDVDDGFRDRSRLPGIGTAAVVVSNRFAMRFDVDAIGGGDVEIVNVSVPADVQKNTPFGGGEIRMYAFEINFGAAVICLNQVAEDQRPRMRPFQMRCDRNVSANDHAPIARCFVQQIDKPLYLLSRDGHVTFPDTVFGPYRCEDLVGVDDDIARARFRMVKIIVVFILLTHNTRCVLFHDDFLLCVLVFLYISFCF